MTKPAPEKSAGAFLTAPVVWAARAADAPLRWWQKIAGRGGMIAFFLIPNMAVFAIFVLVPLVINVAYSVTGGTDLFLPDRPYVGAEHFDRLLSCDNHLEPGSCRDDFFWIAVWNTARFVIFQVTAMTVVAMITALILNRAIPARGFWRAVFLSGSAFARGCRADLALDFAA